MIDLGKRDRRDRPISRAVVANGTSSGAGTVLWCAGPDIENEVRQISSRLDDLGLDDAPHGISVWEGRYVWFPGSWEYPQDGESMPEGAFRAPTDDEWQAIREGRSPWIATPDDAPLCSICHEPQLETPSGTTCGNGHGGEPAAAGRETL